MEAGASRNESRFVTGGPVDKVISADFNGDGKPDLAVAVPTYDSVSILLGDGSPDKAKISKVKVSGPSKVKKGKQATYKVKITNSGNANAKGVSVKVRGKGISSRLFGRKDSRREGHDRQGQTRAEEDWQGQSLLQGDFQERRRQDREEGDQGQEVGGAKVEREQRATAVEVEASGGHPHPQPGVPRETKWAPAMSSGMTPGPARRGSLLTAAGADSGNLCHRLTFCLYTSSPLLASSVV